MAKYTIAKKIVTDASAFQNRVNEIDSSVAFETVKHVISEIKDALYAHKDLTALCAPQIGENLRVFVVKTAGRESNKFKVFLNPMVVNTSKEIHLSRETNASFEDKQFIIPRKNEIHVAYQTFDGHVESETFKGVFAEVVQQMIEMLDGITVADYGLDLDDLGGPAAFDKATNKDKQAVIQMYLDSLKSYSNELKDEIDSNPDLKKVNDLIDFNTRLLTGEIKPVDKDGEIVEFSTPEQQMEAAMKAKGL